jgi:hypothetical protein
MLLRNHPLMRYRGLSNYWPPAWLWIDGVENKHPRGEIGILTSVEVSNVPPGTFPVSVTRSEIANYLRGHY